MLRFKLGGEFEADCVESEGSRIGRIYHFQQNEIGSGGVLTPVARYFVWRPNYEEGVNPHWQIDCFVSNLDLAPEPEKLGKALATALIESGRITLPIWLSWHTSIELDGEQRGDLWED